MLKKYIKELYEKNAAKSAREENERQEIALEKATFNELFNALTSKLGLRKQLENLGMAYEEGVVQSTLIHCPSDFQNISTERIQNRIITLMAKRSLAELKMDKIIVNEFMFHNEAINDKDKIDSVKKLLQLIVDQHTIQENISKTTRESRSKLNLMGKEDKFQEVA